MVNKFLFTHCSTHHDCTQEMSFVDVGDPGYDMSTDSRPISGAMQTFAETEFGEVFCVGVEHRPGALDIKRVE